MSRVRFQGHFQTLRTIRFEGQKIQRVRAPREIFTLFSKIVQQECATILMAAHDLLADEYVDEVLQLSDGQITERDNRPGTVQKLTSV